VPNQYAELGSLFLEMKELVMYLQLYMTLSGINIILMLARILKLMDFQPRLGRAWQILLALSQSSHATRAYSVLHDVIKFLTYIAGHVGGCHSTQQTRV